MMRLYFSGVGGIGMSALAAWALERGFEVFGSDQSDNELIENLRLHGAIIKVPQNQKLPENLDLFVYSEAVSPDHLERQEALQKGIPQQSYFQALGEFSKGLRTIAVAGSHGKTTTTGLIAAALISAELDPTAVVGSRVPALGNSNFRLGQGDLFVVEACEYRNNFQFLSPEIVILTNVEWDHPDAFPTQGSYEKVFEDFCAKAKVVFYHPEDALSEKILRNYGGQKIPVKSLEKSFPLKLIGDHNRQNAALAVELGKWLISDLSVRDLYEKGLQNFSGTGRRQEYLGTFLGHEIYDDYGHHPTEISATIAAFRQAFPDKKIALVFQPHQFSRTRVFLSEFQEALKKPDFLALMPIYAARDRAEDREAVTLEDLGDEQTFRLEKDSDLEGFFKKIPQESLILFMGAGDISQRAREWIR